MEFSLYTSNATSILLELDHSCSIKLVENQPPQETSCGGLSLYMRAIASIIHDDGRGIMSANGLFVFPPTHQQ